MKVDKVQALQATELFGQLPEVELQALAERAVPHRLSKDEVLFVGGETARGLYVIVQGAVRAFRESPEGREQVLHVERAPATIAEVPVFDDGPYPSTVTAEEEAVLLFIEKSDVRRLCLEYPQIALAALRLLANRLRRAASLVEVLSLRQVDQRVSAFLLAESRARGRRTEGGVIFDLTLTNQQIATRVGTVREIISRVFGRLQQQGLIRVEGRSVIIRDESALIDFADESAPDDGH